MSRNSLLAAAAAFVSCWLVADLGALQDKKDTKVAKKPKLNKPFDIDELGKKVFHISFPANQKATIRIRSADESDVDLFMEELDGTEIVNDIADSKDCFIEFTPLKNKTYRISVVNIGPGGNRCTLTHTGKEEKIDFGKLAQTKPFNIAENGRHTIDVKLAEGKWAAAWVTGQKATDVDVYVFDPDGNEIAKDEHLSKDCFVSFMPKAAGVYRIEVRNLGEGDNTCTMKHTTLEQPKKDEKKKAEKKQ
ncbi:MAG: hypothetical protein L0Y71_04105 [Gemmataceae bacterium]|nr:hypothetical protein [Gemmataceae bacterium]